MSRSVPRVTFSNLLLLQQMQEIEQQVKEVNGKITKGQDGPPV
tara:strand:+ start:327 stop:455 length:129 start_codon:yes stop_codon:yes gene_type:complete